VVDLQSVATLLEQALPGAEVTVDDIGGGDHLYAHVRAPQFAGRTVVDQHRMVYAPLQPLLDDGSIHALRIKTEALP
jgi:acid stress-induced BolA-like protein IbaG/YrbA